METIKEDRIAYISSKIRNIPDFPKPGVQFKDITTLLQDPKALRVTSELLAEPFKNEEVDYVLGIESRGFIFGSRLAQDCNAGFVPVRKPGKLPAETLSASYQLEYGTDTVEIHEDVLNADDRVIIHDDLIATGGSASAVTKLVQHAQATIVGYSFIIELQALKGLDKLLNNVTKSVLISY